MVDFFGIILAAHCCGKGGKSLFTVVDGDEGFLKAANMGQYMKEYRFKEIKQLIPVIYSDSSRDLETKRIHGGILFKQLKISMKVVAKMLYH